MWKNWLSFSGSQRAGITVLLTLILIVLLARFSLPFIMPQHEAECRDSVFIAESEAFMKSLEHDSAFYAFDDSLFSYKNRFNRYNQQHEKCVLFAFDPNTIDSSGFVKLGLKPWLASNILRYRKKGGKFKTPEQFSKVYGLDSLKYAELKPFIQIANENTIHSDSLMNTHHRFNRKFQANLADTNELKLIKGVSPGLARMIVQYRNKLGGYHNINQLKEVFSMNEEKYALISPYLSVDSVSIRKINVNTASVEKLKSHPYLNFYQAKSLYEYRRKKGRVSKLSELNRLEEFNAETVEKIEPYLDFK